MLQLPSVNFTTSMKLCLPSRSVRRTATIHILFWICAVTLSPSPVKMHEKKHGRIQEVLQLQSAFTSFPIVCWRSVLLPINREDERDFYLLQAKHLFEESAHIQRETDPDSLALCTILTELAGACHAVSDHVQAKLYLQQAVQFSLTKLGADHPDTALSKCRLAACKADLQE